jgi:Carboxypeptidase regulatory-like domain
MRPPITANRSKYAASLVLLLTLSLFAPFTDAQLTRSTVLGTVTDTTDSLIGGVRVTLRNVATGTASEEITEQAGVYRFLGVEPEDYSIEFAMQGFQTRSVRFRVGTAQEVVVSQVLTVSPVVPQVDVVEPLGDEVAKTTPTISRTLSQSLSGWAI